MFNLALLNKFNKDWKTNTACVYPLLLKQFFCLIQQILNHFYFFSNVPFFKQIWLIFVKVKFFVREFRRKLVNALITNR